MQTDCFLAHFAALSAQFAAFSAQFAALSAQFAGFSAGFARFSAVFAGFSAQLVKVSDASQLFRHNSLGFRQASQECLKALMGFQKRGLFVNQLYFLLYKQVYE
jgi:ABC-type transporter Mla subunit MlaD